MEETQLIPLDKLVVSPLNMRRPQAQSWEALVEELKLDELARDIEQNTLMNDISVRPSDEQPGMYEIFAGQRRFLAHRYLNREDPGDARWQAVRAKVHHVSKEQAALMSLSENFNQKGVDPFARAASLQWTMEKFGLTQRELAKRLHKSEQTIAEYLSYARLAPGARELVQRGELGRRVAVDLVQAFVGDAERQEIAATLVVGLPTEDAKRVLHVLRDNPAWFSLPRVELRARVDEATTPVPAELRNELLAHLKRLGFGENTVNFKKMTRAEAEDSLAAYKRTLAARGEALRPIGVHDGSGARPFAAGPASTALEDVVPDGLYAVQPTVVSAPPFVVERASSEARALLERLQGAVVTFAVEDREGRVREVRVPLLDVVGDEAGYVAAVGAVAKRVLDEVDDE